MRNRKPKARPPALKPIAESSAAERAAELTRIETELAELHGAPLAKVRAAVDLFISRTYPHAGPVALLIDPGHGRGPVALTLAGTAGDIHELMKGEDWPMEGGDPLIYGPDEVTRFFGPGDSR